MNSTRDPEFGVAFSTWFLPSEPPKCECGSKSKFPEGHSDWCPMHKDGGKEAFNLKAHHEWTRKNAYEFATKKRK